jgi:amino acid transporter
MLCFAEVGSRITSTGGAYTYIETVFGKYAGYISALLYLFASVAADAAVANSIAEIISLLLPFLRGAIFNAIFFTILFGGLAYINVVGLKKGLDFVKIVTILKIVPLLIIIFIGFKDVSIHNLYWQAVTSVKQVGELSLVLFFAFIGAESGLSVSGEVKNPKRTIPQALRLSVIAVLAIYILVQTISQGILGDSLSTFKANPLAEVANHIFGPIGFTLITIGAGVSMFGFLSSEILNNPRILFAASKDRLIPVNKLSLVHNKYATPYVSIIVYAGLCLLFSLAGGFRQLAIISSASALLIYLGVTLATIKLRIKGDSATQAGAFRIRGGYTVPVLASGVILWFLTNLADNEIKGIALFLLLFSIIYLFINPKVLKQLRKKAY